MKLISNFRKLKTWAKKVVIGLMIVSLVCTATGVGSLFAYATENMDIDQNIDDTDTDPENEEEPENETNPEDETDPNKEADVEVEVEGDSQEGTDTNQLDPDPTTCEHTTATYHDLENNIHGTKCTVCGYVTSSESVTFNYAHVDDTSTHNIVCPTCSEVVSTEDCTYESATHIDGTTTHSKTCTVCNGSVTEDCTFGDYTHISGTETHKRTCSECGYELIEECEFDSNGVCTHCGYDKSAAASIELRYGTEATSIELRYGPKATEEIDYTELSSSKFADPFTVYNGSGDQLTKGTDYNLVSDDAVTDVMEAGESVSYVYQGIGDYAGLTLSGTVVVPSIDVSCDPSSKSSDTSITITCDEYQISDSASGSFSDSYEFSSSGSDQSVTLYFKSSKNSGEGVISYTVTGLTITSDEEIEIQYDGSTTQKAFYYTQVTITADGYKICTTSDGTFSSSYVHTTIGKNQQFDLYFMSMTSGTVTKKRISGLNIIQESSLDLLYNGEELKDWYNTNVTLTCDGHTIATSSSGTYADSYVFTGSGVIIKDLYFSDVTDPVTVVVAIDRTAPTGTISVLKYSSSAFVTKDKNVAYTSKAENYTITSSDDLSGVDTVEYYLSESIMTSKSEVDAVTLYTYDEDSLPSTAKGKNNYIYAKITDLAGNKTYISTGNILSDVKAPTMSTGKAVKSGSDIVVAMQGKDDLSGINRFKMLYEEYNGSNATPSKSYIFDSGTYIEVKEKDGLTAASTYTVSGLDETKKYVFFLAAVDRAGNISNVIKVEGPSPSSSGSSGSSSSSGTSSGSGSSSGTSSGSSSGSLAPAPSGIAGSPSAGTPSSTTTGIPAKTEETVSENPLDREISREPYIAEATGTTKIGAEATGGWNKIASEIEKASVGTTIEVEMCGTDTVHASIFAKMAGKDVTVKFRMASDVKWTVVGTNIQADSGHDTNMDVRMGSKKIPDQVLVSTTGTNPHYEFTVSSEENFGFPATISIPVDTTTEDAYANFYNYNKDTKEMVLVGAAPVSAGKRADYELTQASDYTVVISTSPLVAAAQNTDVTTGEIEEVDNTAIVYDTGLRLPNLFGMKGTVRLWLFAIAIFSAAICIAILLLPAMQLPDIPDKGNYL